MNSGFREKAVRGGEARQPTPVVGLRGLAAPPLTDSRGRYPKRACDDELADTEVSELADDILRRILCVRARSCVEVLGDVSESVSSSACRRPSCRPVLRDWID